MSLEVKCNKISLAYRSLNNEKIELIPLVLAHFNDYVKRVINPSLPEGFSLSKSEHAFSNYERFIIYSGNCKFPHTQTSNFYKSEQNILRLFDEYKTNTAWVEQILNNFKLNNK